MTLALQRSNSSRAWPDPKGCLSLATATVGDFARTAPDS